MEIASPTPISTRQLGFGTATFMRSVVSIDKHCADSINNECGTPYEFFRVGHALTEAKLALTIRLGVIYYSDFPYFTNDHNFLDIITTVNRMPAPIASIINEIGIYKHKYANTTYCHTMEPDVLIENTFVPTPENVRYSNLRKTVEALAQRETPLEYRKDFISKNPIPGAIWSDDHLLLNPDEIISSDYSVNSLNRDISNIQCINGRISRKYPKSISKIDWNRFECSKSFSVSTNTSDIAVTARRADEDILTYCRRICVNGNTDDFSYFETMDEDDLVRGISNLMGEVPASRERSYYYTNRIPRFLTNKSCKNYKSAMHRFTVW